MSFLDRVRSLDAAPKIEMDFLQRTSLGACVSLFSIALMAVLFVTEVKNFFTPQREHELYVDVSRGDTFSLSFDVTFPHLPCSLLAMDVENSEKQRQEQIDFHEVFKTRLNADGSVHRDSDDQLVVLGGTIQNHDDIKRAVNGTERAEREAKEAELKQISQEDRDKNKKMLEDGCGSCYGAGAEGECCNTCSDIRNAYRKKGWAFNLETTVDLCKQERVQSAIEGDNHEGCRVKGKISLPLQDGNFHFAPSQDIEHARMPWEQVLSYTFKEYDLSHTINKLQIGPVFPDAVYPLAGVVKDLDDHAVEDTDEHDEDISGSGMFQYYLKVVPTDYVRRSKTQATYQYSATEHFRHLSSLSSNGVPGLYFYYEISPIRMRIREIGSSFGHFLTNVCAIVGGTFTVMGMVDSLLHVASQDGGVLASLFRRRGSASDGGLL